MLRFPVASVCKTYSTSSRVTDSAVAGTAISTGHKAPNSMLGMAPDTTDHTSIAVTFRDNGYGVGIITSAAHSNDGGAVVKEIVNFNQAIDAAYAFYQRHPKETA